MILFFDSLIIYVIINAIQNFNYSYQRVINVITIFILLKFIRGWQLNLSKSPKQISTKIKMLKTQSKMQNRFSWRAEGEKKKTSF